MDKVEFAITRRYLGKTQRQMAQLLCISPKAVQSFEQGWRDIPANCERQLLFLLSCKCSTEEKSGQCWEIRKCPAEVRERCPAWEFKAGYFCWFITGTFCEGNPHHDWAEKIKTCRRCKVYKSRLVVDQPRLRKSRART